MIKQLIINLAIGGNKFISSLKHVPEKIVSKWVRLLMLVGVLSPMKHLLEH